MTRQEIIDSLIETGHGENILRCQTGVVKVGDFTRWLQRIMANGSNEKTMICDIESIGAVCEMGNKQGNGFRLEGDDRTTLLTPYGPIKLRVDVLEDGIAIIDQHAFSAGRLIAQSQGVSDTIREIVI